MVDEPQIKAQTIFGSSQDVPTIAPGKPGANFRQVPTVRPTGLEAEARAFGAQADAAKANGIAAGIGAEQALARLEAEQLVQNEETMSQLQVAAQQAKDTASLEATSSSEITALALGKYDAAAGGILEKANLSAFQKRELDARLPGLRGTLEQKASVAALQRQEQESNLALDRIGRNDAMMVRNDPSLLLDFVENAANRLSTSTRGLNNVAAQQELDNYLRDLALAAADGEIDAGAGRGRTARNNIEGGKYDEMITPDDKRVLTNRARAEESRIKRELSANAAAASKQALGDALLNGYGYDNDNKDHRDAAEAKYAQEIKATAGDPDASVAVVKRFAQRGIFPKALQSQIRASIDSNDPAQMTVAARILAGIDEVDTEAIASFKADRTTQAKAAWLVSLQQTRTAEEAAVAVRDMYDPSMSATRQILEGDAEEKIKNLTSSWYFNIDSKVDDMYSSWLAIDPDIPEVGGVKARLRAGYVTEFRANFIAAKGNEDLAHEMTERNMRNTFAPTTVNGSKVIMKYAPEAMYPVPAGATFRSDWIREQLVEDATEDKNNLYIRVPATSIPKAIRDKKTEDLTESEKIIRAGYVPLSKLNRNNVMVSSDAMTESQVRSRKDNVDYSMHYMDDSGMPVPVHRIVPGEEFGIRRWKPNKEKEHSLAIRREKDRHILKGTRSDNIQAMIKRGDKKGLKTTLDTISRNPTGHGYLRPIIENALKDME